MLEAKLRHNKIKTKNVKVAKMVEFIRTCDHTLVGLILVFFSTPLLHFLLEKKKSSENAVREEWVISFCMGDNDKNLGGGFAWRHE